MASRSSAKYILLWMHCSSCHNRPATVHVYEVQRCEELEYCAECAIAAGLVVTEGSLTSAMLQNLEMLQLPIAELRARIDDELRNTQ